MRYERPEADVTVVDDAEMVQRNAFKTAKTFRQYSKIKVGDKVHSFLDCVHQLDIIFDVYQKGSRKKRKVGSGQKMVLGSPSRKTLLFRENLRKC